MPSQNNIHFRKLACGLALLAALTGPARAAVDVPRLQQMLRDGKPEEVRQAFEKELAARPNDPRLLYNRAVAAYAAGRFEDALVDLDAAEADGSASLASKAGFQKGNAEFRLGLASRATDAEVTISRWRQAVANYERVLKNDPEHDAAKKNYQQVRKLLFDLLMKAAREKLEAGKQPEHAAEDRIQSLRGALDQFSESSQMEPDNAEAKAGAEEAKERLAQELAKEGTRKTMATALVPPAANEPPLARPDTDQIQEGVNMLEDAQALQPNDPAIAQQLQQGRDRLADALTVQAMLYQSLEPRIQRSDDKLGLLRMALELTEKALEQAPKHQMAQQVQNQLKQQLAQLHEQLGDQLDQRADQKSLEQQAQDLSQAMDHFQQAAEMQPQQSRLPQKAQHAQSRLEKALEQLADKLSQPGRENESLEEQAMRLEGAEQALHELQSLRPSQQTAEQAQQIGKMLAAVRAQMAGKPQPGGKQRGQQPAPMPPEAFAEGMPLDSPPKLDTPGSKGPYQSGAMNRSLRDY